MKEENKKLLNENKSLKSKVLSVERLVTVLKEDMRELFTAKNKLSAENGRLNALVEEKEQEVVDLWSEIAYERNAHQETKIELDNVTNKLAKSSGNVLNVLSQVITRKGIADDHSKCSISVQSLYFDRRVHKSPGEEPRS